MRMWARGLALVALIATTVGCDRLSKQAVVRHLAHRSPRSFLADSVRLDDVENRGAFLSLGAGLPAGVRRPLLIGTTGLLLVGLGFVIVRRRFAIGWDTVALSLVWAGGASNLLDRLASDRVVDFLSVGIGPLRTGTFNVADAAITLGCGMALWAETTRNRGAGQRKLGADGRRTCPKDHTARS